MPPQRRQAPRTNTLWFGRFIQRMGARLRTRPRSRLLDRLRNRGRDQMLDRLQTPRCGANSDPGCEPHSDRVEGRFGRQFADDRAVVWSLASEFPTLFAAGFAAGSIAELAACIASALAPRRGRTPRLAVDINRTISDLGSTRLRAGNNEDCPTSSNHVGK